MKEKHAGIMFLDLGGQPPVLKWYVTVPEGDGLGIVRNCGTGPLAALDAEEVAQRMNRDAGH